jgi:hypothetical protein
MGWIVDNLLPESFFKSSQIGDIVILIGLFYTIKWAFKTLCNLHETFKTFILPLFWPRNLPEEYGSWAVVTGCSKGQKISKANCYVLNSSNNKQMFSSWKNFVPQTFVPPDVRKQKSDE